MNRRTFVGLLCGGATVVSGCSTPGQSGKSGEQSNAIEDRQFELVDPDERFDPDDSGWDERFQHGADVRFTAASERVVVRGRLRSGGRSCRDTVLDSARYDEESDTLTVVILDTVDESNGCTLEIAIIPYRATITFDGSFPERTVVEHRDERSGHEYSETFTHN